jgi:type I restriction enzyme M protein
MVAVMKPQAGEHVNDPAAGTIGFIVAADRYIKAQTDDLFNLSTDLQEFQKNQAYTAMELVPGTHRLALMNALLHDIHSPIVLGDTLSGDGKLLKDADLVLTNPPFGTKKGGGLLHPRRLHLPHQQQATLLPPAHLPQTHSPGGRAAVVLPDNVLFEAGVGKDIRAT